MMSVIDDLQDIKEIVRYNVRLQDVNNVTTTKVGYILLAKYFYSCLLFDLLKLLSNFHALTNRSL